MQSTARADDPDGGIKDVQIWMTTRTTTDDGDTSGRVSYTLTPPSTGGNRRYVIWARALNFYGGRTETRQLTIDVP
jgi:hypothetical protein